MYSTWWELPILKQKRQTVLKDRGFAIRAKACWLKRCGTDLLHTDLCANINRWLHLLCPFSFISYLFWRLSNKLMHLVAGCVMEGSMVFCQKNILGHSMMFHGDYIQRCLLTIMVSQILYLTQLISEIKNILTATNRLFSTTAHLGWLYKKVIILIWRLIYTWVGFCNKLVCYDRS